MAKGFGGLKALVVDDDALIADVVVDELGKAGILDVKTAYDGASAVKAVVEWGPDVVVMDVEMPGLGGIEAARRIQDARPTPVVILSVYTQHEVVAEAAESGVGAYVVKPPKAQELERAIMIATARFNDLKELRRLNAELKAALDSVKVLSGMLPICASCKKIRDDKGFWSEVEMYISEHSDALFTHSICPDCARRIYGSFYKPKG